MNPFQCDTSATTPAATHGCDRDATDHGDDTKRQTGTQAFTQAQDGHQQADHRHG